MKKFQKYIGENTQYSSESVAVLTSMLIKAGMFIALGKVIEATIDAGKRIYQNVKNKKEGAEVIDAEEKIAKLLEEIKSFNGAKVVVGQKISVPGKFYSMLNYEGKQLSKLSEVVNALHASTKSLNDFNNVVQKSIDEYFDEISKWAMSDDNESFPAKWKQNLDKKGDYTVVNLLAADKFTLESSDDHSPFVYADADKPAFKDVELLVDVKLDDYIKATIAYLEALDKTADFYPQVWDKHDVYEKLRKANAPKLNSAEVKRLASVGEDWWMVSYAYTDTTPYVLSFTSYLMESCEVDESIESVKQLTKDLKVLLCSTGKTYSEENFNKVTEVLRLHQTYSVEGLISNILSKLKSIFTKDKKLDKVLDRVNVVEDQINQIKAFLNEVPETLSRTSVFDSKLSSLLLTNDGKTYFSEKELIGQLQSIRQRLSHFNDIPNINAKIREFVIKHPEYALSEDNDRPYVQEFHKLLSSLFTVKDKDGDSFGTSFGYIKLYLTFNRLDEHPVFVNSASDDLAFVMKRQNPEMVFQPSTKNLVEELLKTLEAVEKSYVSWGAFYALPKITYELQDDLVKQHPEQELLIDDSLSPIRSFVYESLVNDVETFHRQLLTALETIAKRVFVDEDKDAVQ